MASRYAQWMYDWETRLTSVDNNRVVRPLEWGVEWARDWPCRNGSVPGFKDSLINSNFVISSGAESPVYGRYCGVETCPERPGGAQRRGGVEREPAFTSATLDQSSREPENAEQFFREYNQRIVAASDEFYSYTRPSDFRLERREVKVHSTREVPDPSLEEKVRGTYANFLRFTSPVHTPYPENNLANARWFPAAGRNALVLLPHWNSDAVAYTGLCRVLNFFGIAVLRLSMPYHDIRMPAAIGRADYAVSANIGRTMDAARQGVIDIRCCFDWLESQGYKHLGIAGTSLGSCYAFLAAAHDPRIRVAAFNHASTYFADVVWHGQSTRHIRHGLEKELDVERLRVLWSAISPMSYFRQFSRWLRKSLIVYAKYDLTFLPEFSRQVVAEFASHHLDHKVAVLPCGHYTTGEAPFKYIDGWHLASFLRSAFEDV